MNSANHLGALIDVAGVRAKVVYVSRRFKDVIGIRHHAQGADLEIIYTSRRGIGRLWPVVGHEPVTEVERQRTRRIVADDIYVEDELERPAKEGDYAELLQMDVCGSGLVERWAKTRRVSGAIN